MFRTIYYSTLSGLKTILILYLSGTAQTYSPADVIWQSQISGTTNPLHSVYFINEDTGWVVGDNGTILKTSDGGVN